MLYLLLRKGLLKVKANVSGDGRSLFLQTLIHFEQFD